MINQWLVKHTRIKVTYIFLTPLFNGVYLSKIVIIMNDTC
jgi:hypothetical protein